MKPIGINELIALNDEILALSRAGVPLGRGLLDMGSDMPQQLQAAAESIGARLEQGESLEAIVASKQSGLPPAYSAVVAAGVQSGRLPVALEKLSSTLARVAELRRVITLASVYPLFLVVLTSTLVTFVGTPLLSTIRDSFVSLRLEIPIWLSGLFDIGICIGPYAVYVGCGTVTLAVFWLIVNRRFVASRTWLSRITTWLPGLSRLLTAGRTAAFLETLRLLVSQRIPLDRAVTMAAESTGDTLMIRDAASIAENIRRGADATSTKQFHSIPPLVSWLLTSQQTPASLNSALDSMAEAYSERTQRTGELLRTLLPVSLTVAAGGTVTVLYIASISIPWVTMLHELSKQ